ncbi:MAG: hypothetical protein MMC33_007224 [Icmadophila ericetorum]|nr:hypothetical protein [Icmadophila ericetorum]
MTDDTSALRRYYEELRGTEHAKNMLIEERDAFVLVLIDGDGMIFEDRLLQKGEVGGKEAAGILWLAVKDYVHQNLPNLSSDYKIVTRIYANLKGLGEVCSRSGLVSGAIVLEDFARGFTGSKQLFDFVDVGSGKDRADDKICGKRRWGEPVRNAQLKNLVELFKLHLYNCHCRHILFGCSHDNGYARLLEDLIEQQTLSQITLLEGVPFERELATLVTKYQTTKFPNLFRTSKIDLYQNQYHQLPLRQRQSPEMVSQPTASSPQPMTNHTAHANHANHANLANLANHGNYTNQIPPFAASNQAAIARAQSGPVPVPASSPMAPSWASTAGAAPPAQIASPPPTPSPHTATVSVIPRNKYGQRVDPMIQYDKSEVKRVQKIKMCNVHFLRNDCPYGNECEHDHFYKPNKNELLTLRFIARQTPCRFGTGCDDTKCIYGHRCPTGQEGSKDCRFGASCRFDPDMHGIDLKVVRTTKV